MLRHTHHLLRKPSSLIASTIAIAIMCVAGPAVSVQASATAHDQPANEFSTCIQDLFSRQYLDAHVNGAVFTETGSCTAGQELWIMNSVGQTSNGYTIYTLTNSYSDQCLDAHVNGAVFTESGACTAEQEEWIQKPDPTDVQWELVNDFSQQCLDNHVNGAVFTDGCDGYGQQAWYIP